MREDIIALSRKEIKKLRVIHMVMDGCMIQEKAGELLGLSGRQVRRIIKKVKQQGDEGIRHGNRGRGSPRKMSKVYEDRVIQVIKERYRDFGPTLASEKLLESEGIRISKEKLRQVMLDQGIWQRKRRRRKIHPWRQRKEYLGEMVQMDGSHHDWLEGRGPQLVLMGYIDDATNRFFGRFYDYEGVYPAMDTLERYIRLYGVPVSLYLDKHSTYKTTRQPSVDELLRGQSAATQFERACREVGTKVIHAHSPQAKGRIERVFATLQDRLVKEMRLAGVNTIKEANEFLEYYLPKHNERFAKEQLKERDLHQPLPKGVNLYEIFCLRAPRTINNGYIIRWKRRRFLIHNANIAMRRQKVVVREHFDSKITIKFNGRYLKFQEVFESKPLKIQQKKEPVKGKVSKKGKYIPPPDHPWRRHNPKLHHNCYLERI